MGEADRALNAGRCPAAGAVAAEDERAGTVLQERAGAVEGVVHCENVGRLGDVETTVEGGPRDGPRAQRGEADAGDTEETSVEIQDVGGRLPPSNTLTTDTAL